MTDPSSPDQGSKPFKPDLNKPLFGDRMPARPFAEPDPSYDASQGFLPPKKGVDTIANQETRFSAAAIECVKLQDKVIEIIRNNYPNDVKGGKIDSGLLSFNRDEGTILVQLHGEAMQRITGGSAIVELDISNNPLYRDIAEKLNSPSLLPGIGVFSIIDDELLEKQKRYIEKHHHDSHGTTQYFFSKNGGYYKVCHMPIDADAIEGRKRVSSHPSYANVYESEMTADDFEIAGQALQMLINRLKPVVKPAE